MHTWELQLHYLSLHVYFLTTEYPAKTNFVHMYLGYLADIEQYPEDILEMSKY